MGNDEVRSKNEELRPCPFCGKPARLFYNEPDDRINKTLWDTWIVGCETGLCPGYIWKANPVYYNQTMARNRWNRRNEK